MAARIVGIGQAMAGDDGVGIAVANYISDNGNNAGIEVVSLSEPSRLLPLLTDGANPVVLIDAVLDAGDPGRILMLKTDQRKSSPKLLSTHGVGVRDAIALARTIDPEHVSTRIVILGVTISRAGRHGESLSPEVAAAIPMAAARALALAHE